MKALLLVAGPRPVRPNSSIQWHAYPALFFAGAMACGIAVEATWSLGDGRWIGGLIGALGLTMLGHVLMRRHLVSTGPLWMLLAAVLAGGSLGGIRTAIDQMVPADHVVYWTTLPDEAPALVIHGQVVDDPARHPRRTRFVLATDAVVAGTDTVAAAGRVQVTLRPSPWDASAPFPHVGRGDRVALTGSISRPRGRRNPADMDYAAYLARQGIFATMNVYDGTDVAVVGQDRAVAEDLLVSARSYVRGQLATHVPSVEARAVLAALVLGDRSGLDATTRDRFARTGLMHLLAVSGLHVLLVGMVLYRMLQPALLRLSRRRLRWRTVEVLRVGLTMALLLAYLFLSGTSTSAVRAVVMAGLFLGGAVLHRTARGLNTLGVAAVVLLLVQPGHLFSVGFQLSFAAVAAIVTIVPRLQQAIPYTWQSGWLRRPVWDMGFASFAATLGTAPVLLYHFGYASAAGLVLNLAAIPATALSLGAAFTMLTMGGVWPALAGAYGTASDAIVRGLLELTRLGDRWLGWAAADGFVQDPWALLAMTAGLVAFVQWPRPRHRWRLLMLSLAFVTGSVWIQMLDGPSRPHLDVVFFDVGHGDATLLRLPNGRHMLIDAGARGPSGGHGRHTILPHLDHYGIDRLDAILVSHPHGDHLGGVPALLREVSVGQVITSGASHDSHLYADMVHVIDSAGVPHRIVQTGDTLDLDASVRLQILAPDSTTLQSENANDASIVVRVIYGSTTLLFTGDAERDTERRLIRRYAPLLRSDVVKVGHHGSSTSSTAPFVTNVSCDTTSTLAVISAGTHGFFELPDGEVVTRWQQAGAAVQTTKHEGAIWLRSDGRQIQRVRWR